MCERSARPESCSLVRLPTEEGSPRYSGKEIDLRGSATKHKRLESHGGGEPVDWEIDLETGAVTASGAPLLHAKVLGQTFPPPVRRESLTRRD